MGVKLHLIAVLICISLMVKKVEHFFMCLLAICIFSLEKWLLRFFVQFKGGLFAFVLLNCKSSSFWILDPYQI